MAAAPANAGLFAFEMGRPAKTGGYRWFIVFALNHVLGTPLVKAENCIVQIEPVRD